MYWSIFGFVTSLKLLLIPAYYSTDFEVHRNWLAVTHSLPLSKWYFDETSPWTLDYPPYFAYFEYFLSHIAKFFDEQMLRIDNLNYASEKTIIFQRLSVILADVVYALGVRMCIKNFKIKEKNGNILALILLSNVGLIFVDHIHFQYNGFLFGILLLSIAYLRHNWLLSAFLFAALLNFKHIFLYVSPVYGVFFLKFYCFDNNMFLRNIIKLISIAVICLITSFGPFINHIPQIFSRLFPFKRGLTHAYWAPNFWALYNFIDKIGCTVYGIKDKVSNTGGLVQEYEHLMLPTVKPILTFFLTAFFMIPCIIKLVVSKSKNEYLIYDFVRALVICSCTSFMFGWHVHEKAILMVLIPLSLLSVQTVFDAEMTFFLSTVGYYSLLPLLFKPDLLLIKYSLYLSYIFTLYSSLKSVYPTFKIRNYEFLYYFGLFILLIYENVIQFIFHLNDKLPFLPLMLTSVYCNIGVLYFYSRYYYKFLCMKIDIKKKTK